MLMGGFPFLVLIMFSTIIFSEASDWLSDEPIWWAMQMTLSSSQ